MRNYCCCHTYIKMTSPELRARSPASVAIIVKPDYKLNPGDPCNHSRLRWPPSYLQYASCRAAMHTVGVCVLFLGWGDVFLPSTPADDRSAWKGLPLSHYSAYIRTILLNSHADATVYVICIVILYYTYTSYRVSRYVFMHCIVRISCVNFV